YSDLLAVSAMPLGRRLQRIPGMLPEAERIPAIRYAVPIPILLFEIHIAKGIRQHGRHMIVDIFYEMSEQVRTDRVLRLSVAHDNLCAVALLHRIFSSPLFLLPGT